jgi:hypothetical protein
MPEQDVDLYNSCIVVSMWLTSIYTMIDWEKIIYSIIYFMVIFIIVLKTREKYYVLL